MKPASLTGIILRFLTCAFLPATSPVAAVPLFTDANWVSVGTPSAASTNSFARIDALLAGTNGDIFAGGYFTNIGQVSTAHVALWDGSAWTNLGTGVNGFVTGLARDAAGNVYACGLFGLAGGVAATNLARWDGTGWSALPPEFADDGVGGVLSAPAFDSAGNLYVGGGAGFFASDFGYAYLLACNGSEWHEPGGVQPNNPVSSVLGDSQGHVYVGGEFTRFSFVSISNIAEWTGTLWLPLGPGFGGTQCDVAALAMDHAGNLYAGGYFSQVGSLSAHNVAKWDGAQWSALGSGVDGYIETLACDPTGHLYAGGYFSSAGGATASNIAMWNGTNWFALGSGVNSNVDALAFDSHGNLFVSGEFTRAGTNVCPSIAEALVSSQISDLSLSASASGAMIITALGSPGSAYSLDRATNLTIPITWSAQVTNTFSGQTISFTNLNPSVQGYYRIRSITP